MSDQEIREMISRFTMKGILNKDIPRLLQDIITTNNITRPNQITNTIIDNYKDRLSIPSLVGDMPIEIIIEQCKLIFNPTSRFRSIRGGYFNEKSNNKVNNYKHLYLKYKNKYKYIKQQFYTLKDLK